MLRLRGRAIGGGVALGSALALRPPLGIPLLPERMVAQRAKAAYDSPVEPIDVIVLAPTYEQAASFSVPWARVVGILAESEQTGAVLSTVPTLLGMEEILAKTEDETLILLDADRGVALVDPDGMTIAAYQAQKELLAPRRRLHIDDLHLPARSLDGREIHVIAHVRRSDDIARALEAGADALYVAEDSPLVPAYMDDEAQTDALMRLGEAAGGKPIYIAGHLETLSLDALLKAGLRADFTMVAPLGNDGEAYQEIQNAISAIREQFIEEDIDFQELRFAAGAPLSLVSSEVLEQLFINRLIITLPPLTEDAATLSIADQQTLEGLSLAATNSLIPLEPLLSEGSPTIELLEALLGIGVAGLIVEPGAVEFVKGCIRNINIESCRIALLKS